MKNKIYLQLFAEGAGEAGGAAVETGLEGQSDQQTVQVQTDTGEESTEDRGTKWKNMIKGEFKDEYNQSVQKVINDRFKQTKEMEERLSSSQKVLDFVAQRYGLDKTADADDMLRALEEDDSMFEERATAKGMSTEQYREFYRLEKRLEFSFEGLRWFDIRRWGLEIEHLYQDYSTPTVINHYVLKAGSPNYVLSLPLEIQRSDDKIERFERVETKQ